MPGAFSFLDAIDPTAIDEAPEGIQILLPSRLPHISRGKLCISDLPHLEFRFRLAQAHDALDLIRHFHGVYQVLLVKNQVHISGSQGTMTKSKTVFLNFKVKIDQAAARYRDARAALLRLDPNEKIADWKEDLRELRREDVRGPSREGKESSESRQQLPWIWKTPSLKPDAGINDPKLQDVMRVEWCKAVARVERFEEEVELTVEEMKRTLAFFKWTAGHWEQLGRARDGEPMLEEETAAGLKAYAACKAALYHRLVVVFVEEWYECLDRKSLGSTWLSKYDRPEVCRRRRLPSNVKAYHPSAAVSPEEAEAALANDCSEAETESAGALLGEDEVGMEFFDDL